MKRKHAMQASLGGKFHSSFGGLWTDRVDASQVLSLKVANGDLDDYLEFLLDHWIRKGYVILEHAVEEKQCAALSEELKRIFQDGSETARYQTPEAPPGTASPVPPSLPPERMRLVDLYAVSPIAAAILMAPTITNFLKAIFQENPLCFQGLTFEKGSGQGLHQDTAYVVIDRPLELAAAWVALEDVKEGSGELMYVEGSHRLPDWKFGGKSKHWDPAEHGPESHTEWSQWLIRKSEELGLERKSFRPRRGDVLIWSADLVHGGSPIADRTLTRRSLVGHYCPVSCTPHYFSYLDHRYKLNFREGYFSSAYYDLRPGFARSFLETSVGHKGV